MTDVKVVADKYTRDKLKIKDTISPSEADRVQKQINDSKEFRSTVEGDRLTVRRVIRD